MLAAGFRFTPQKNCRAVVLLIRVRKYVIESPATRAHRASRLSVPFSQLATIVEPPTAHIIGLAGNKQSAHHYAVPVQRAGSRRNMGEALYPAIGPATDDGTAFTTAALVWWSRQNIP
jgi:hypothetical protein